MIIKFGNLKQYNEMAKMDRHMAEKLQKKEINPKELQEIMNALGYQVDVQIIGANESLCPECLSSVPKEELAMFNGLCENCTGEILG